MIQQGDRFQVSVNIRFDLGKDSFIKRYLPTSSHAQVFEGILKGFLQEARHSHIVVGPYGSGKSLIGTVLGSIASKQVSSSVFEELINKFSDVSNTISNALQKMNNHPTTYIPVLLEGKVDNFRKAILTALIKSINEQRLDIIPPGFIKEILKYVELWEEKFPNTFRSFQDMLKDKGWNIEVWRNEVINYEAQAINWFKSVYPKLTSGSELNPSVGDFLTQLDYILDKLAERNLGIILIYDEFGRMLQSLGQAQLHETMQDLQDIAELADHCQYQNFNVLLITHRNMKQYALRLGEEVQKELQRIEGRFAAYHVESDQVTFVRLASQVTREIRNGYSFPPNNFYEEIWAFDLFPELNKTEIESLIINGSYPLHPATIFVLPRLANIVAQNERTLFTFLESEEKGGLRHHFEKEKTWYLIDQLFDYFEPAFEGLEVDSHAHDVYLLYKRLATKLAPTAQRYDQLRVLKALSIWEIGGLSSRVLPTVELLAFALGWKQGYAQQVITQMEMAKAIRHRAQDSSYILFEGSHVNLKKEVEKRIAARSITDNQRKEALQGLLHPAYILPNRYNDERSMIRFAKIYPIFVDELMQQGFNIQKYKQVDMADLAVFYIFADDNKQLKASKTAALQYSEANDEVFFVIPNCPLESTKEQLAALITLKEMETDAAFLQEDRLLIDEIAYHKQLLYVALQNRLEIFMTFDRQSVWCHKGKVLDFVSDRQMNEYMSDFLESIYKNTPEIRNESFNRRQIPKVQKKAAIKVIETVLRAQSNEEIQIEGYGPDYLIFATVLKNNGIKEVNETEIKDSKLNTLYEKVIDLLEEKEIEFERIVSLLTSRPFGIRRPVVPVILSALLKPVWKYIMLYRNGMFVSKIDGELLWSIVEDPARYTVVYQVADKTYSDVELSIEKVFGDFVNPLDKELQKPVFLSRALIRWLRSLPRITQTTNRLSDKALEFRQYVRQSEVNPLHAIDAMGKMLNDNIAEIKLREIRNECETFLTTHNEFLEMLIYEQLTVNTYQEAKQWAVDHTPSQQQKSKLLFAILNSWEENWIENIAEAVVGVTRKDWSDATEEVFESELRSQVAELSDNVVEEKYLEAVIGNDVYVIPNMDLNEKAKDVYDNIKGVIDARLGRGRLSREEASVILLELLKKFTREEK